MHNLGYEFQLSDQQFVSIIDDIREAGGSANDKLLELDGMKAGYTFMGSWLRLRFEHSDGYPHNEEPKMLKLINMANYKRFPSVWPPSGLKAGLGPKSEVPLMEESESEEAPASAPFVEPTEEERKDVGESVEHSGLVDEHGHPVNAE